MVKSFLYWFLKGKTEFLEKIKEIATPEELVALNIINPQEGQPSKEPI